MKKSIRRLLCLSTVSFTLLASTGYAAAPPPLAVSFCQTGEAPTTGNASTPPVQCFAPNAPPCPAGTLVGRIPSPPSGALALCNLYRPPATVGGGTGGTGQISMGTSQSQPPQCGVGQQMFFETTRNSSGPAQTINLWQCFTNVSFAGKQAFSTSLGGTSLIAIGLTGPNVVPGSRRTATAPAISATAMLIPLVGADGNVVLASCTPPTTAAKEGQVATYSYDANGMCAFTWKGGSQAMRPSCPAGNILAGYTVPATTTIPVSYFVVCASVYQPTATTVNPGYVYAPTGALMGSGAGGAVAIQNIPVSAVTVLAGDPACRSTNNCPPAPAL